MNLLKALKEVKVFKNHDIYSEVVAVLNQDELHEFNREKRRGGFNFYELIKEGKVVGYVLKDKAEVFVCTKVELSDEKISCFSVKYKENPPERFAFSDWIYPVKGTGVQHPQDGKKHFEIYSIQDEEKQTRVDFHYDPEKIDIELFHFREDDEFYITYKESLLKSILIEVDNLKGKKGFMLANTNYKDTGSMFVQGLGIFIMFAVAIGIILFALANGWLVFGKILFIVGIIAAVVIIVVGLLLKLIIGEIINQIWKRL